MTVQYLRDNHGGVVCVVAKGEDDPTSTKFHALMVENLYGVRTIWTQPIEPMACSYADLLMAYTWNELYDYMTHYHLKGNGF